MTTCYSVEIRILSVLGQYASALQVSPGCFRHNEHLRLLCGSVESYWCFGGLDLADKEGIFFKQLGGLIDPLLGS